MSSVPKKCRREGRFNTSPSVALPRGCLPEVRKLFERNAISVDVQDERCVGVPISARFLGALSAEQERVASALAQHDIGVLSAPTAFGKTVIGAWLIAERGVNTLVLVHRQHLPDQWHNRLAAFLDLPGGSIGQFGGDGTRAKARSI